MMKHVGAHAGKYHGRDKGNPHGAPPGRYGPNGTGDLQRARVKKGKR